MSAIKDEEAVAISKLEKSLNYYQPTYGIDQSRAFPHTERKKEKRSLAIRK